MFEKYRGSHIETIEGFPELKSIIERGAPLVYITPRCSVYGEIIPVSQRWIRLLEVGFQQEQIFETYGARGESNSPTPILEIPLSFPYVFVSHPPGMGLTTPDDRRVGDAREFFTIDCYDSPPRIVGFEFKRPLSYGIGVYRGGSCRGVASFVVEVKDDSH